jgi:hypothetical protein
MRKDLIKALRNGYRRGDSSDPPLSGDYGKTIHPDKYESDDNLTGFISSGRRRNHQDYKELKSINYSALQRLLKKHVGRPWNIVYSELCEVNTKSDIPADQFKHAINQLVNKSVELTKDSVKITDNFWATFNNFFYVHPENGLLCFYKSKRKKKSPPPITKLKQDDQEFELIDDSWYRITFGQDTYDFYRCKWIPNRIKQTCNKKELKIIKDYLEKHG